MVLMRFYRDLYQTDPCKLSYMPNMILEQAISVLEQERRRRGRGRERQAEESAEEEGVRLRSRGGGVGEEEV